MCDTYLVSNWLHSCDQIFKQQTHPWHSGLLAEKDAYNVHSNEKEGDVRAYFE